VSREFSRGGKLMSESLYGDDRLIAARYFDKDGNIIREEHFPETEELPAP
jgi:hypothetical protein